MKFNYQYLIAFAIVCLLTVGSTLFAREAQNYSVWPAQVQGIPDSLGVSMHLRGKLDPNNYSVVTPIEQADLERQLDQMAALGVKIVRTEIAYYWDKSKDEYDFKPYHRVVDECCKRGLKVLTILSLWDTRYEKTLGINTEKGRQSFARFCGLAAGEFKGQGIIWEMWNEPNLEGFWGPKPDPGNYSAAIRSAVESMKKADPDCVIVALSTCTFDMKFLEACIQKGMLEYISAVGIHPYSDIPETQLPRYLLLKDTIDRYAPAGRRIPIVCTEWGYSRLFPGANGNRIRSQDEQAALIVRSILVDQIADVPMHIIYTNLDYKNEEKFEWNENHYGLLTVDGKPKAAAEGVKTLAEQLKSLKLEQILYGNDVKSGENLEGDYVIVFSNSTRKVIVAWTTHTPHKALIGMPDIPEKILDMKGLPKKFSKEDYGNNALRIELTTEPIYLIVH